jgi:hypothetical protein
MAVEIFYVIHVTALAIVSSTNPALLVLNPPTNGAREASVRGVEVIIPIYCLENRWESSRCLNAPTVEVQADVPNAGALVDVPHAGVQAKSAVIYVGEAE